MMFGAGVISSRSVSGIEKPSESKRISLRHECGRVRCSEPAQLVDVAERSLERFAVKCGEWASKERRTEEPAPVPISGTMR